MDGATRVAGVGRARRGAPVEQPRFAPEPGEREQMRFMLPLLFGDDPRAQSVEHEFAQAVCVAARFSWAVGRGAWTHRRERHARGVPPDMRRRVLALLTPLNDDAVGVGAAREVVEVEDAVAGPNPVAARSLVLGRTRLACGASGRGLRRLGAAGADARGEPQSEADTCSQRAHGVEHPPDAQVRKEV